MNASNRLVCANIKAKGIEDGLNKLMLYLHSYPKEYVLNLLSAYTNCLVSTALVTSLTGNIQPLIGIAQINESLRAQLRQEPILVLSEEFIQKRKC